MKTYSKMEDDLHKKERDYLAKIRLFACSQADLIPDLIESPFKCNICKASLKNLIDHLDLIESYSQKIENTLQPKPLPPELPTTFLGLGDNFAEIIAYLKENGIEGFIGEGTLFSCINWDNIEEDYQIVAKIVQNNVKNRIIVDKSRTKFQIERMLNSSEMPRVWVSALEDYEPFEQELPDSNGIIGWVYDLIPVKDKSVRKIVQHILKNIIIVKMLSDRDLLFQLSRYTILTLSGELISDIGDIEAGKL